MPQVPQTFCLIDDTMTLHGLRFKPEGGDMSRFMANPVLLYMHVRGQVHGRWENIRLEGGRWLAEAVFDTDDPESAKIAGKVERGFLKACSMGVYPQDVQLIDGEPWAMTWLAGESSIVDFGSNGNALRLCGPDGEPIEDTEQHILQLTKPIMAEKKDLAGVTAAALSAIALAAGLAEDATETSVALKIKEIVADNATKDAKIQELQLAAETTKTLSIKTLLDQAVTDKKISASERPHYETLAAVNFDSVQAIIAKMPVPVDLAAFAKTEQAADFDDSTDFFEEYNKLDRSGKLEKLHASNPVKFKALYKARWGKDFPE